MQIFIKHPENKYILINSNSTDTIRSIKYAIEQKEKIPIFQQRLLYQGKQLENQKSLQDYCIGENSTIYLLFRLYGGMKIYVRNFVGNCQAIDIQPTDSIRKLWEEIERKMHVSSVTCKLVFNGQFLQECNNVEDYGIESESIINPVFGRG